MSNFEGVYHRQTQMTIWVMGLIILANISFIHEDIIGGLIWLIMGVLILIFNSIITDRDLQSIKSNSKRRKK